VVELLKYDHLLMPVRSVEKIVEMFGEAADDALQMKRHPRVVLRREKRRAQTAFGNGAQAATPSASTKAASASTTDTTPAKTSTRSRSRSQEK
jgi:hypothetical protein